MAEEVPSYWQKSKVRFTGITQNKLGLIATGDTLSISLDDASVHLRINEASDGLEGLLYFTLSAALVVPKNRVLLGFVSNFRGTFDGDVGGTQATVSATTGVASAGLTLPYGRKTGEKGEVDAEFFFTVSTVSAPKKLTTSLGTSRFDLRFLAYVERKESSFQTDFQLAAIDIRALTAPKPKR